LAGAHIGGGAGAFAAAHSGTRMSGIHRGGDFQTGHERNPHLGHRFGYYDYGYDNSCLGYPPFYRPNLPPCH
jgi:hypothetical protein